MEKPKLAQVLPRAGATGVPIFKAYRSKVRAMIKAAQL